MVIVAGLLDTRWKVEIEAEAVIEPRWTVFWGQNVVISTDL
jgi:hypothetical protein